MFGLTGCKLQQVHNLTNCHREEFRDVPAWTWFCLCRGGVGTNRFVLFSFTNEGLDVSIEGLEVDRLRRFLGDEPPRRHHFEIGDLRLLIQSFRMTFFFMPTTRMLLLWLWWGSNTDLYFKLPARFPSSSSCRRPRDMSVPWCSGLQTATENLSRDRSTKWDLVTGCVHCWMVWVGCPIHHPSLVILDPCLQLLKIEERRWRDLLLDWYRFCRRTTDKLQKSIFWQRRWTIQCMDYKDINNEARAPWKLRELLLFKLAMPIFNDRVQLQESLRGGVRLARRRFLINTEIFLLKVVRPSRQFFFV